MLDMPGLRVSLDLGQPSVSVWVLASLQVNAHDRVLGTDRHPQASARALLGGGRRRAEPQTARSWGDQRRVAPYDPMAAAVVWAAMSLRCSEANVTPLF